MTAVQAAACEPLEQNAEWRASDIADADAWTLRLGQGEIAELESALAFARQRRDNLLDVEAGDFPLPMLGPKLGAIEESLINGRGFARISGLPVERLGVEDASWIYWGIGRHLGDPWPQNAKGHLLGDVIDQGKAPDDPTARGNEIGGHGLTFHSDGSDLVGLMCVHPGVSGGESLIANAVLAHNELVRTQPNLAAELYQPLPYDFRGEQGPRKRPFYTVPVFTRHRGRLFVRYIRPFIESSQRHDEAPRLTDRQIEAMDAYDMLVAEPDLQAEMRFQPGDMQFINNYHVLHGRRRYLDDPSTGQVRFLKRLWLATSVLGADDRPERFQRDGSMSHWAKNRTQA